MAGQPRWRELLRDRPWMYPGEMRMRIIQLVLAAGSGFVLGVIVCLLWLT